MEYTRESDSTHYFTQEPVAPPPGFPKPSFTIGQRVKVAFSTLNPMSRGRDDGKIGTVSLIVFAKSDGRTILYGVKFDNDGGGRFEGFELDPYQE